MTNCFNDDDVKFPRELGDWFDWEIDDGEIALTRRGEVKLNGKLLSNEMVTLAAKYSCAFKDAVRMWRLKADELACEADERMSDEQALHELKEAQRIINKLIDEGFVTDVSSDQQGHIGLLYEILHYADRAEDQRAA